ncbi:cytochrome c oxidase subunit II [Crocosphaera subtropica ATCC 51142]|uniref:Cytochrome c oxidase subunit 2 n=1 Tax=Crocosphaera subtropica (strain ATCC 51142 / BH68) TaxID=43989 RepID=B1X202_CROS5|nr:cytochrome c oxidase subunit II [Crocosphaera subtropica]ACB54163.1 cytochrome c oxidase subunit II [Crocosphaera subtropica ATCC 51142]
MKKRRILLLMITAIALSLISLWIGQLSYGWLPPQGTTEAILIDNLFTFLVSLGSFIFLGVTGVVIYFVMFNRVAKYDWSDGPAIEGNVTLEIIWTVIPILLVFWIAGYSYQIYQQMGIQGGHHHSHQSIDIETVKTVDKPFETIEVIAKQWAWIFHYPESNITSTELHLPIDQRVHLALRSQDVLHGFYIPAFRVKQDMIPQETIALEFTPIRQGNYQLTDSQFSGTYFATMTANVVVQSKEDYETWLKKAAKQTPFLADNQAFSEYNQQSQKMIKTGWPSIKPAQPPLVNYQ